VTRPPRQRGCSGAAGELQVMKLITAFAVAVLAALATTTGAHAAVTCVTVGATWVDNQQITPAITVCAPTP
jgi:hypothetical protein